MKNLITAFFSFASVLGLSEEFHVGVLPNGAEVTVPGNTATLVDLSLRVKLTSTESIQTLRFVPVATNGKVPAEINLAIYDRNQERVQYVTVKPQTPFLYSLNRTKSIYVIPEFNSKKAESNKIEHRFTKLKIESDKPIELAR